MFDFKINNESVFDGTFFKGTGDVEYLQLLDIARRMFNPDPEYQNLAMFYHPKWNGLVEGPTWGAWWVQNSYGTTYCSLPFLSEPFITFLQNSQDLWFNKMGDGKNVGCHDWIGPDGVICDCASPDKIYYKQGDGRIDLHDWGMEYTAAAIVMQAELLLISRDSHAIENYLPKLRRSAEFIESRRDPENNLFLAGAAGNLLAPSYAGWKKTDGTYDKAYLSGLSISYIVALDRLIELEKLSDNLDKVELYTERRELAKQGLKHLVTEEGYFIKSLDPDGIKHGVYGEDKHGYFEAVCNHDAICFRVVDDQQAEKIFNKIASIPGLRPHDWIITNYPELDDMYEVSEDARLKVFGYWNYGKWVNGGHWATCEARMIMGYYRLGKYEDARRSMKRTLELANSFRMDAPLGNFGASLDQPNQPINCVYDAWGVPAAMLRGLFEYLYRAEGLTIIPHIPTEITMIEQKFPVRLGKKQIFLSTVGQGAITRVYINGESSNDFDRNSVFLAFDETPDRAFVQICFGDANPLPQQDKKLDSFELPQTNEQFDIDLSELRTQVESIVSFYQKLSAEGFDNTYEAAHAKLVIRCFAAAADRFKMQRDNELSRLPEPANNAAHQLYVDTVIKLYSRLKEIIESYAQAGNSEKQEIYF